MRRLRATHRGINLRSLSVALLLPAIVHAEVAPPPTPPEDLAGQSSAEDEESHPSEQVAEARRLFLEGSRRAQLGEWEAALGNYEAAFALYGRAATLYNVAYCHAQLGNKALAWQLLARALNEHAFPAGRRLDAVRRQGAERLLEEWFAGLAVIEITPTRSEVQVRVDGRTLAPSDSETEVYVPLLDVGTDPLLGQHARLVLDPGRHQLRLRAQSVEEALEFDLPPGARLRLRWPAESEPAATRPTATRPATKSGTSGPASPAATTPHPGGRSQVSSGRPVRTAGWIGLGVAGAGAGVALVSGVVVLTTGRRLDRACGSEAICPPSTTELVDRYETSVRWTNLGLLTAVGAGALGAGLLWWDTSGGPGGVQLAVSPTSMQLSGSF